MEYLACAESLRRAALSAVAETLVDSKVALPSSARGVRKLGT